MESPRHVSGGGADHTIDGEPLLAHLSTGRHTHPHAHRVHVKLR